MEYFHGSTFSRSLANESKKGAYYTDTEMCRRIGRLLSFPQGEEVTVLEPSVGDGSAVRAVLENSGNCSTPLFCVELDNKAAKDLEDRLGPEDVLVNSDFIRGVSITPSAFGYCFANPPYGTDEFLKRRYEQIFLEKIYTLLKKNAICTYVVPYYLFERDSAFVSSLMARFELLATYRFDDEVYKQFQQVSLVLRRRPKMYYGFGKKAYEQFIENLPKPEELPYLPEEPTEEQKITVPVAKKEDIKLFTTAVFDSEKAGRNIVGDPLDRILGERVFSPEYKANELTRPPLPPKKDILYLCAIAGAGQGLCGNAQEGDLHLQRGVVKTVTDRTIRESENGKGAECVETTRAAITMTVVEADGTIRHLS